MATKTNANATGKKTKGSKLTSVNLGKAVKAKNQENERESKYNYPDGLSALQKKQFRRAARKTVARYEDAVKAIGKSNKAEDKKALETLNKEHQKFLKNTYTIQS